MKGTGLFLVFTMVSGCATTIGPSVSSSEVAAKTSELEAKAAQYRASQLKRVWVIGQRLISLMPAEDREKLSGIRYEVVEKSEINAFATWGKLGVTYGMLRFCESDDELAVVISHELAHLTKGHVGKSVGTSVVAAAIGVAAGAALSTVAPGVGSPVAQGISQGIAGGFSRDYEREADYFGLQYAYVGGFDVIPGSKVWERFAIEVPKSMTADLFSTHPPTPERLVRAEKTLEELAVSGIQPNAFNVPGRVEAPTSQPPSLLKQTMGLPVRVAVAPVTVLHQAAGTSLAALPSEPASKSETANDPQRQIQMLLEEQQKREQALSDEKRRQILEQEEMEQVLLEAKETAKQYRYAEFGVKEMGLAKQVTNLWLGQKVEGKQLLFPLSHGKIEWFAAYGQATGGTFKALALMHRKYRAYWYTPDGRLYSEQDFIQSRTRADFAKTTLEWDPELGQRLLGKWLVRVFQDGKLIDERTFEVAA